MTYAEATEAQRAAQSALDALPSCIAALDASGTVVAFNEAWGRARGAEWPFGAHLGVGCDYPAACEALPSKDGRAIAGGVRDVLAGRAPAFSMEYPWDRSWLLTRAARRDGAGPVRAVVTHEDITERKGMETDLRERVREVADLNHRLASRTEELATYHDLVAHDVSNFSMAVLLIADRLLGCAEGPLSLGQRELARRVRRQSLDMARRAENARILTRLRDRGLPVPAGPVRLADVIARAIRTVRTFHFERSFEVVSECAEDLTAWGPAYLDAVLVDLLDNAVRHTPRSEAPRIGVRARAENGTVAITIRGGRAPHAQAPAHFFERRAGCRLGLAFVQEVVRRSGGTVEARAEGGVCEVALCLPGVATRVCV